MSATVSGPIVLENPSTVDHTPHSVEFVGQMWLGEDKALKGRFRYYNLTDMTFEPIGYYIAWVHIANAVPSADISSLTEVNTEDCEDHGSGSETIPDHDDLHVFGDIFMIIESSIDRIYKRPCFAFTGVAFNSNKDEGFFHLNAAQYTTFYKCKVPQIALPIRASFDNARYKFKKPVPKDNTYVSVESFIDAIDMEADTGQMSLIHVTVFSITFLGKAPPQVRPKSDDKLSSTPSHSTTFKFGFPSTSPPHSPSNASSSINYPPPLSPTERVTRTKRKRSREE